MGAVTGGRGGSGIKGGGEAGAASGTRTAEARVLAAARYAARNSTGFYRGNSVPVADVRDEMGRAGMSDADFDRALVSLHDQGKVRLASSNASRMLTPRQRAGGIRFGGNDNQIVYLQ